MIDFTKWMQHIIDILNLDNGFFFQLMLDKY